MSRTAHTSARRVLAVDEPADRGRQTRHAISVGHRLAVRSHGQVLLVHREVHRAARLRKGVVPSAQAAHVTRDRVQARRARERCACAADGRATYVSRARVLAVGVARDRVRQSRLSTPVRLVLASARRHRQLLRVHREVHRAARLRKGVVPSAQAAHVTRDRVQARREAEGRRSIDVDGICSKSVEREHRSLAPAIRPEGR